MPSKECARVMLLLVFAGAPLGACALFEPSSASRFKAKPGTPTEIVFACAESTIHSLKEDRGHWSDVVTKRDSNTGLFETNRFKEVNIAGIRTQIKYEPKSGQGRIKIKASGPYFVDLGADQAAEQLAAGMAGCL